jgi:hypothetical protein
MLRSEDEIKNGLRLSEKLFKKKYKNKKLMLQTFGGFEKVTNQLKKIIIATEICTLQWVTKKGGSLNALNKKEWEGLD